MIPKNHNYRAFCAINNAGFKSAFYRFKKMYNFLMFTPYGALFQTNTGFFILFKPV